MDHNQKKQWFRNVTLSFHNKSIIRIFSGVTPSDFDDTSRRTTRALRITPLCKDGYLRPYLLSVVIDATARSTPEVINFYLVHSL